MEDKPKRWPRPRKIGDSVEALAMPIAKALDYVLKTNIQGCGGCKARKEWLNSLTEDNDDKVNNL